MQPERGGAIDLEIDLGDNRPFRPRLLRRSPRSDVPSEELLLLSTLSHDELLLLEGVGRGSLASRWVRRSHRLPADGQFDPVRVFLGRYTGVYMAAGTGGSTAPFAGAGLVHPAS